MCIIRDKYIYLMLPAFIVVDVEKKKIEWKGEKFISIQLKVINYILIIEMKISEEHLKLFDWETKISREEKFVYQIININLKNIFVHSWIIFF